MLTARLQFHPDKPGYAKVLCGHPCCHSIAALYQMPDLTRTDLLPETAWFLLLRLPYVERAPNIFAVGKHAARSRRYAGRRPYAVDPRAFDPRVIATRDIATRDKWRISMGAHGLIIDAFTPLDRDYVPSVLVTQFLQAWHAATLVNPIPNRDWHRKLRTRVLIECGYHGHRSLLTYEAVDTACQEAALDDAWDAARREALASEHNIT